MSKKEYTHLLEYLDERFSSVDNRLTKVESRLDRLDIVFDGMLKRLLSTEQELVIAIFRTDKTDSAIERIERWIKLGASKLDIPYAK